MISVNKESMTIVRKIIENPEIYKVAVNKIKGVTIIDCGITVQGGWEIAREFTKILYGGISEIYFETFPIPIDGVYYRGVNVSSDHVVLQQAGCNISGWELKPGVFAPILAGPGRTIARKVGDWLQKYTDYQDNCQEAVITIETSKEISEEEIDNLLEATGVHPNNLYILVAPSGSVVCSVQVAARILEQTLHRLCDEGFELDAIINAHGFCIIPPVICDDLIAMGRLNDVLIYGGQSTYTVDCEDEEIEKVIHKIVAINSPAYGEPFKDIYQRNGCDFYRVPMGLYSPAKVIMNNQRTGRVFSAGKINVEILQRSFNMT
jgi:methenyltetrahydromethanopterin cyclohydrolase